jgi:peptidyl-prolyl cis-trans isomerase D
MLDILRANARSALTYVLFGIIIVVFVVSFGPGSCGQNPTAGDPTAEDAAKVNGQRIGFADVEQYYGQLLRNYQQQVGDAFNRDVAEQLGFRRLAVDQLVEHALMVQEARRQGLVVSDDEVERAIKSFAAFQSNGRFDHDLYSRIASQSFGSPARFEQKMREDLLGQRIRAVVVQTAKVSEAEVREAWLADADRANLELVRFPLSLAREEVQVSAADAEAYAKANEAPLKKAYEEDEARFERPKRVKARQVLARVAEGAPEDAAKAKAEQAAARARKGEDFGRLVAELSDDAFTKERGGDVGWLSKGSTDPALEEAAFGAKPGDVVGPVRTAFGFQVLRIDEVQEPETVPFEKARLELARERVRTERAKELANAKAQEALAAAKSGRALGELFPLDEKGRKAVKWGGQVLRPEETGPFAASQPVPRIGSAPELVKAAFAAEGPAVLDRVFETPAGPVVARVKERQRADPAQFEAKKVEVTERLRAQREREVLTAWMKGLRDRAKIEVHPRLAAADGAAAPQ